MSGYKRRIQNLEIEVRARTSSLTLDDGRVIGIPPFGWLTLADAAILEGAAAFEGSKPPEPTPEQERPKELFAQARFDPAWGEAERKFAAWARGEAGTA